jgi:hypothetical protein
MPMRENGEEMGNRKIGVGDDNEILYKKPDAHRMYVEERLNARDLLLPFYTDKPGDIQRFEVLLLFA